MQQNHVPITQIRIRVPKRSHLFSEAVFRVYDYWGDQYLFTSELLDCPPGSGEIRAISSMEKFQGVTGYEGSPWITKHRNQFSHHPPTEQQVEEFCRGYLEAPMLHID